MMLRIFLVLSCSPFCDAKSWTRLACFSKHFKELVMVLTSSACADAPKNRPAKHGPRFLLSICWRSGSKTIVEREWVITQSQSTLLVCFEGLARLSRRVWRRFVRGSHSCHDALICERERANLYSRPNGLYLLYIWVNGTGCHNKGAESVR